MAETAVPVATLGVEDPKLRPSARRSVPAPGDDGLRPLADDIATEPDPAASLELEAEARRFGDGRREPGRQARRLEGEEKRLCPTGEPGEPTEAFADLGRRRAGDRSGGKVDHEDVHRAAGEEHPGDRETLVERLRREHDEPIQANAAGGGLDRVERVGKIEPGDDRAVSLGLGDEPQGERRGAGARSAPERDACGARQATGPDDGVERREAGPDDALDASSWLARRSRGGSELGWVVGRLGRIRRRGERSDHPRSCGTPPRLEGRESSRHVRGEVGHRMVRLEQTFDIVNALVPRPRLLPGDIPSRTTWRLGCLLAASGASLPPRAPPRHQPRPANPAWPGFMPPWHEPLGTSDVLSNRPSWQTRLVAAPMGSRDLPERADRPSGIR